VAAFILRQPGWEAFSEPLSDSFSPELCLNEVANAVVKATRRGEIKPGDARLKFRVLQKLVEGNLRISRQDDLLPVAFEMALGSSISVYDYLFIALAKTRLLPLCTRDKSQHKEALRNGVSSTLV
jgi:predicted nucleic acid-binding protein